ncbi:uncharacterized protein LOC111733266 [Pteropus vampyrus]|uniref:Uncharacterized protein LOC111733266 n=1 Tax=Pteropus vampyrus TaxID=132908 RepID=A0A6P6C145_PTEVA|nr:uncharacterized protein LOC111733266 [Pteropus vampyrus]
MVRPGAQEQRSAKRVVCLRARGAAAAATHPAARSDFSFPGFLFYSRLLQRCTGLPCRVLGEHVAGDTWAVPAFLIAAPEPVSAFGKRPGRSSARRADPAALWGAGRPWGPGRAQPPPPARGGEGRGRRSPETWREHGGNGPQLLAGGRGARERRSLPLGAGLDPAGVWLRFFRPFPAFERPRERASIRAEEGAAASARTPPHVFSFQSGRLRGEPPIRPVTSGAAGARR